MTFEVREMALGATAEGCSGSAECHSSDESVGSVQSDVSASELQEQSPFCQFVREDGGKCRAMARRPSEFCFWHDPAEMTARQSERAGSTIDPLAFEPCDLKTGADVYGLLERAALYAALTPRPDLKRLQILNVLASSLLRSIHVKELEVEVAALRAELAETNRGYDRCWKEKEQGRHELEQLRKDNLTWFGERNKLRSYLRSLGTDPDSLPEKWMVDGRSIFEHPPPETGVR